MTSILDKYKEKSTNENSLLDRYKLQKNEESIPKELVRGFATGFTPTFSSPQAEKQRVKEAEASPEELVNLVEGPDVLPSYTDFPTRNEVENFLQKLFGQRGEEPSSKYAQRIGNAIGVLTQMGGLNPASALASGAGAAAGEFTEQKTGSPLLGMLAEILTTGGAGAAQGGLKKVAPNELMQKGAKIGLPEKVTAPLSASKEKMGFLGKFAAKGTKTENVLKDTKNILGEGLNDLSAKAKSLPNLTPKENFTIIKKFDDVSKKIKSTLANTADEKEALKFIDQAKKSLTKGTNPENLLNFYRTINSKVNWNNMSRGDMFKKEIQEVIKDTFRKVNPEFAEEFELFNTFYSKYFDLEKSLGQTDLQKSMETFNKLRHFGQLGWGFVTGNPIPIIESFGEGAARVYARESLINPTIKKLNDQIVNASKKGAEQVSKKLIEKEINYLKHKYPKDFDKSIHSK